MIVALDVIAGEIDTEAGAQTIAIEISTGMIDEEKLLRRTRVVDGEAVAGGVLQPGDQTARSPTVLEDVAEGTSDMHKELLAF